MLSSSYVRATVYEWKNLIYTFYICVCGWIQKLDFVIENQKKKKKKKEAIIQMKNVNVIRNDVLWLSLQVIKHLICTFLQLCACMLY